VQLDQIIQHNASASEEMASISDELSGQAKGLEGSISFFTIRQADVNVKQKQLPEFKHISTGITPLKGGEKTGASYSEYLDSDEFERF
jgi:methyl-accepting chemotaxis protein